MAKYMVQGDWGIFRSNGCVTANGHTVRQRTITRHFILTNIEKVRIMSDGNVGIGTTSPGYKLDVSGDINFTGDLYQNDSLFGGGMWFVESNSW